MKKLTYAAVATFLAVGSTTAADAATYNLELTENQDSWIAEFDSEVTGSFADQFAFTLPEAGSKLASAVNVSFTQVSNAVDDLQLRLFQGEVGSGTELTAGETIATRYNRFAELSYSGLLDAGSAYYLEATGTVPGGATLGLGGSLAVAPVPVPAALPMFGAALVGLGFVGRKYKNKTKAPAGATA